jgi:hypothetical protein
LTTSLQFIKSLKPYTLAGFEPGIFCSGGGRDDRYATYCEFLDTSFWFSIRLLTEPWEWLLDYSTKANVSFLAQPSSQVYKDKKLQIEQAVSTQFLFIIFYY